jgi:hypothetical protein
MRVGHGDRNLRAGGPLGPFGPFGQVVTSSSAVGFA